MLKVALLDDYPNAGLKSADWSPLDGRAEITVFDQPVPSDEAAQVLAPFDVLCTMRERMALPGALVDALPNLKLVTVMSRMPPNIDVAALTRRGIPVCQTRIPHPDEARVAAATPELTWGLLIATVRHFGPELQAVREGRWQTTTGMILQGRTLGLLGLGRIGRKVARYGQAFGMTVIAWSQNLTAEDAAAVGVERVDKDALFARSDVLSIHLQLSDRTRGLVGARELGVMKPEAYLINTSRGPIVEEAALIAALREGRLAGAGLDVFDREPLPPDHPLRTLDRVTALPHLGYVTEETLRAFYGDTVEAIAAFADGRPVRVVNPEALSGPAI